MEAEAKGDTLAADTLYNEADKWKDGGSYKIALHGALGGVLSGMAGYGVAGGVASGAANEALQGALAKINDPELHKLASLIIGRTVSGNATGGAIAYNATAHNWLNHYDQMGILQAIIDYKDRKIDIDMLKLKLAYYIDLSNKTKAVAYELGINDGIDNTLAMEARNDSVIFSRETMFESLSGNFLGESTLAAGIYLFARQNGIDRESLDRFVSMYEN